MDPYDTPTPAELREKVYKSRYKIGIGLTVLNNYQGAVETLESVKTQHEWTPYFWPQHRFQISLAAAWNKVAHAAFDDGCDYALICNDDILFSPDCIDAMIREYERLHETEKVIMVTPNNIMMEVADDPFRIQQYHLPEGTQTSWAEHPNFSCILIAPKYFEEIGDFDENFWPAWFEDNDSHYRATLLGWKEITTTAAPMVHFGSVSTGMMGERNPGMAQSEAYYLKKWGSVRRDGTELWTAPYGDVTLTPKDWVKQ